MKNFATLLCYLEKKELSPEDKTRLNNLLQDDEELRNYFNFYRKIENTVKQASHIDEEDLAEYVLLMNKAGDGTIRGTLLPKIEEHLRKCSRCMNEFKKINEEYSETDTFFLTQKNKESSAKRNVLTAFPHLKLWLSSAGGAAVLYLVLLIISSFVTPPYYKYAGLNDESEFYVTRGRVTENFQQSIKALEEDNFPEAIAYLKKDINSSPDDETIFYSHYIIGLSYMKQAEKNYFGLFRSYDKSSANEALKNFRSAIEKNISGRYPNITLNAYFYAGKANLMLGNISSASNYFRKVVENKGSKMKEAQNILRELE